VYRSRFNSFSHGDATGHLHFKRILAPATVCLHIIEFLSNPNEVEVLGIEFVELCLQPVDLGKRAVPLGPVPEPELIAFFARVVGIRMRQQVFDNCAQFRIFQRCQFSSELLVACGRNGEANFRVVSHDVSLQNEGLQWMEVMDKRATGFPSCSCRWNNASTSI